MIYAAARALAAEGRDAAAVRRELAAIFHQLDHKQLVQLADVAVSDARREAA